MSWTPYEIARAKVHCWERQRPTLLLDKGQRGWVERFWSGEGHAVWCIGRQRGKSYAALTLACEFALKTPGAIIRYAAKTKDSARGIVVPTLEQILEWCPVKQRPEINDGSGHVQWENGSVLTWAGTDAQSFDRLRGPRAHLILLDESAFYQDLERVEAALLPQLTTTQGKAIYLSTPPESLGHPFVARFRSATASKRAERETIMDNPRLSESHRHSILKAFADTNGLSLDEAQGSTFWRREYLAEFVQEESRAAIPAWSPEMEAACVRSVERPAYWDAYVSCDFGFGHGHGALFAWFDFVAQKLVIEDALYLKNHNVTQFADAVKAKELELWGVNKHDGTLYGAPEWGAHLPDYLRDAIKSNAPRQPYLRVGDDNHLVLSELAQQHGLSVIPTQKNEKHVAVDAVDQAFRRGEIIIHPRAVALTRHLYTTIWNRQRTQWEATPEGHGELVDCFVAGTMIETAEGARAIETLVPGDLVWTRAGLKPVLQAKKTKETAKLWRMEASNGSVLVGTKDHPIHTQFGWVPLSRLTDRCIVTEWNSQYLSSGTGADGSETQTQNMLSIKSIMSRANGGEKHTYTEPFGKNLTVQYLVAFMSIMLTGIRLTMSRQTLFVFPGVSTWPSICVNPRGLSFREMSQSRKPRSQRWNGIGLTKVGSGTVSILAKFGEMLRLKSLTAWFVARFLTQKKQQPKHAESTVWPSSEDSRGLMMLRQNALNVGCYSRETNTPEQKHAPARVVSVTQIEKEDCVYNLAVAGQPEYFANGILVHNCLIYLYRNLRKHRDPRPKQPNDPWLTNIPGQKQKTNLATAFFRKPQ